MNEYLNEYTIEYVNVYGFPCSMVLFSHSEAGALEEFINTRTNITINTIRLTPSNFTYERYDHAKK
jgi:hypothetical protein